VGTAEVGTRPYAAGGEKDEYFIEEYKAVCEELRLAGLDEEDSDLDAVEALIKKLNEADEAR
jgi:hypothetical protein